MNIIWQWMKWCIRFRQILPIEVGYVSDEDLSQEQWDYAATLDAEKIIAECRDAKI